MPKTSFTDRFNAIAKGMSNLDLMKVLDLGTTPVRALKTGDTQTLKLDAGLRLCRLRHASPWWLAGEREPPHDIDVELDGIKIAIYAPSVDGRVEDANAVRAFIVDAVKTALTKYAGTGSVRMHLPKRQVYEGVAEPPEMDVGEMNEDLGLLAVEVKKLRTEVQRLTKLVDEPATRRVAKRAG